MRRVLLATVGVIAALAAYVHHRNIAHLSVRVVRNEGSTE